MTQLIARISDRFLERVVPKATAQALPGCSCRVYCCAQVSQGRVEEGWRYEDCFAGVNCSPCYTNGTRC